MSSSGWEVRFSKSRQLPYYFNSGSGLSVWEKPDDITDEQVASLPGSHYLKSGGGEDGERMAAANGSSANAPNGQVRASHLLVKHSGSRRPSSWKDSKITRAPEEAETILREHAASLGSQPSPEEFASLAKVHSDCSSAAKGGDLGFFGKGQMQKPFEEATFALPVGAMSDVIKTDSGHHLILRTA
ncbi:hypothetical protein CBS101457_001837 [Exobasidium rhododendri]|nr:hypothetical protein CBS101457_001837 [Exobasidium rhododendri]